MEQKPCRLERLVQMRGCSIDCCQHGTVHVNLGSFSFRLGAERLREIALALGRAADLLEARARRRQSRLS
jgi:hypothetical protein